MQATSIDSIAVLDRAPETLWNTSLHILVVDADTHARNLVQFLFEDLGYRVSAVADRQTAMTLLAGVEPDLIVLDTSPPDGGGFELCRQIRHISKVPIIFISADGATEQRVFGLQCGGDGYLIKPFEPAELLARAEALLRRSRAVYPLPLPRLKQGQLALYPTQQQVGFDSGLTVALTQHETRLLYHLMLHAGDALTHDQLCQAVWPGDPTHSHARLNVYISRLRAKLAPHLHTQCITTMRNVGYRFEHP
jgi:DNA-binding response OmpR family regulator